MLLLLPIALLFGVIHMPKFVAARFCEGGHICSLPRECCTQGCCPPYQSGPRQLPPPSEHVLNLFFISHWFFWCVVVAIILAILCAYSLWKKRRTLCGWGFPEHHAQSEGDSAGSCYAPPQYSRCNSFHHPPPPYTEVTSKPDLYPLVFTCNSDNGKNGSSYLMVQYFRNYIVRPAGSLSAASTVDSLSSSFICNINEANTLVPPPYSRAASPEIGFSSHYQQQYMMPRSASQLVCATGGTANGVGGQVDLDGNIATQQVYQGHQGRTPHYTVVAVNGAVGAVGGVIHTAALGSATNSASPYSTHLRPSDSEHFQHNDDSGDSSRSGCGSCSGGSGCGSASGNVNGYGSAVRERDCDGRASNANTGFIQSQSHQHFRYIANSNSSISDIFVSNSCGAASGGASAETATNATGSRSANDVDSSSASAATAFAALPHAGGTPVIFSNGCIKPNPLHRTNTNPTQFADAAAASHREPIYNSCNSIAGISLTVPPPSAERTETEFRDLHMLRRSLETCCQMLQQQQQQQKLEQKLPSVSFTSGADSPQRLNELTKKYAEEGLRSHVTSGTCSGVSSLANIGTPSSPPQATSPTGEVKEILDQIRQLQEGVSYEDMMLHMRPVLRHTLSSPTSALVHSKFPSIEPRSPLQQQMQIIQATSPTNACAAAATIRLTANASTMGTTTRITTTTQKPTNSNASNKTTANATSKRPSTLQQSRKKFHTPKPNKAMYIPMTANTTMPSNRCILKSPVSSVVGANFFASRGRVRKIWVSRSAPTTPGTALPPNRLGDDSPLLTEHDEDQEGEQNEEMD